MCVTYLFILIYLFIYLYYLYLFIYTYLDITCDIVSYADDNTCDTSDASEGLVKTN